MKLTKFRLSITIAFWVFSPLIGLIASIFYTRRLILSPVKDDGSPWLFKMKALELTMIIIGFPVFIILRIIAIAKSVTQFTKALKEPNLADPAFDDWDASLPSISESVEQSKHAWEKS